MKTEPDVFSIDDLASRPDQKEIWDGVRNYQARNFMRDDMRVGDPVLIYHSSCKTVGIAGLAKVSQIDVVDPTQFDPESHYYDPKSSPESPRWITVEIEYDRTFDQVLPLSTIKTLDGLDDFVLLKRGNRLSVMPVSDGAFSVLVKAASI